MSVRGGPKCPHCGSVDVPLLNDVKGVRVGGPPFQLRIIPTPRYHDDTYRNPWVSGFGVLGTAFVVIVGCLASFAWLGLFITDNPDKWNVPEGTPPQAILQAILLWGGITLTPIAVAVLLQNVATRRKRRAEILSRINTEISNRWNNYWLCPNAHTDERGLWRPCAIHVDGTATLLDSEEALGKLLDSLDVGAPSMAVRNEHV